MATRASPAWEAYAGDALDAFEVDSPRNQAFFPWYLYNWRADTAEVEDDGSATQTIAESYLERYAKRVSEMERRLIDLIANQPFSFHEVMACEPGHGYRLKDLLLEREVEVIEHSGSQLCTPGDILFGRVIQYDHVGLLMGCGSILLPPAAKTAIMQLRRLIRDHKARLLASIGKSNGLFHRRRVLTLSPTLRTGSHLPMLRGETRG
jgi:hypothetical protein